MASLIERLRAELKPIALGTDGATLNVNMMAENDALRREAADALEEMIGAAEPIVEAWRHSKKEKAGAMFLGDPNFHRLAAAVEKARGKVG